MSRIMRHYRFRMLLLPAVILIVVLAVGWPQPELAAQESETKVDMTGWTEAMRGHFRDERPPANNPPQSAEPCVGGMAGGFPCENVNLLAVVPHNTTGGGGGNDIWGWTDPTTGNEYAIVGQTNGTAFVDITDPENPIYVGRLPSHTGTSTWRDMKTYADHVFVVSDGNGSHGMQVFDLTELRTAVPPTTFSETAHYPGVGSAHNIAINEDTGYAYIVGAGVCSGGLHFVDISNPLVPVGAGCFSSDGYTHDVQCIVYNGPDVTYQGDEICFAANEDTLTIVNVTDKGNPVQLAREGMATSAYTHQAWVTEDHQYLLLDDELDEQTFGFNTTTYVWDISDLNNPDNFTNYVGPVPSSDHNLYIRGGNAFLSNYSSGLRVLDVSDVANGNTPEIGYFDTFPDNNNANFSGQWSNYPYFESGVVIANDRTYGLFVLEPILDADYSMVAEQDTLAVCGDGSDSTVISLADLNGYQGSVTLGTTNLPTGANATFVPNPVSVPGSSDLEVSTSGVTAGTYPFLVTGSDGVISHDVAMTLAVADGTPGAPSLLQPPDGATGVSSRPTFMWSGVAQAVTYEIEIATDSGFSNIVDSATVADTTYTPGSSLPAGVTLYWHVRANNACGNGSFSATFSFSTLTCSTPNLAIPDNNPTGATDDLVMTDQGDITDLDVYVNTTHTWVGDVRFSLQHVDTGTTVTFYDRPGVPASTFGCSGDDIDATINDEGPDGNVESECGAGVPSIQGDFVGGDPPNPNLMAAFDGEALAGTWRLTASDLAGGDVGTVVEWCILAETTGGPTPTPTSTPAATDVDLSSFNSENQAADWVLWLIPLVVLAGFGVYVYQRKLESEAQ